MIFTHFGASNPSVTFRGSDFRKIFQACTVMMVSFADGGTLMITDSPSCRLRSSIEQSFAAGVILHIGIMFEKRSFVRPTVVVFRTSFEIASVCAGTFVLA